MTAAPGHCGPHPISACSVSLASHDGTSGFGVLCGDLASVKRVNLNLSYFQYAGSSTQMALLNSFHVEILGNKLR